MTFISVRQIGRRRHGQGTGKVKTARKGWRVALDVGNLTPGSAWRVSSLACAHAGLIRKWGTLASSYCILAHWCPKH